MIDEPWTFTVTWDPEKGSLPDAILHIFHYRSEIIPGKAILRTDKGHATFYVRAVQAHVRRHNPSRIGDIISAAEQMSEESA